ncbi:MAG: hypothetical protein AB2L13_04055 [Spirochaetota bacterium]
MDNRTVFSRFLIPLLVALGTLTASSLVYHGSTAHGPRDASHRREGRSPARSCSSPSGFFAFIGPPLAYFRGASFIERAVVAFANPLVWLVRMALSVSCQFTADRNGILLLPAVDLRAWWR